MAIGIATIIMMFSYFPYAAAFAGAEGEPAGIDTGLLAVGLAVAPFVFVALGTLSRYMGFAKQVLRAMGLLIVVGFGVGLLSPVLGATAGFGVGGALTLRRPEVYEVMKWRLWSVVMTVVYTLVLLVVITPAGVFTGGVLPLIMLGFADEYSAWRSVRSAT